MRRDDRASKAVDILLNRIAGEGGGKWQVIRRPDEEAAFQSVPSPDFIIASSDGLACAAVEVTWFDWPHQSRPGLIALYQAIRDIKSAAADIVRGEFSVTASGTHLASSGLLNRQNRAATVAELTARFIASAASSLVDQPFAIEENIGLTATRISCDGPLAIYSSAGTSIDSFARIDGLEEAIALKSRKFDGFKDIPHFLLVDTTTPPQALEMAMPHLVVPDSIDKLYFIISHASGPEVISFDRSAKPPGDLVVDRKARRVYAIVPQYE